MSMTAALRNIALPILIAVFGFLYIFVIPGDPFAVKLLFKLIPMALILLYGYLQMPAIKERVHWLVLIGLVFCAFGDGLLHWFVIGLTAFLIGHLWYVTAFFGKWNYARGRFWTFVPLLAFGVYMGLTFTEALSGGPNAGLIVPVLAYIAVILTMTWAAIMTGHGWLILGSLLFTTSDAILAWNRFVASVPYSGVLVMVTYYSAQFLIAHSLKTIAGSPAAPAPSETTTAVSG